MSNTIQSSLHISEIHFRNIVAVAASDGVLSPTEMDILRQCALDLGIDEGLVANAIYDAYSWRIIIPLTEQEREQQLSDAIYISMIDGEIPPAQYNLCLQIARHMDLNQRYLDATIELVKKMWKKY